MLGDRLRVAALNGPATRQVANVLLWLPSRRFGVSPMVYRPEDHVVKTTADKRPGDAALQRVRTGRNGRWR